MLIGIEYFGRNVNAYSERGDENHFQKYNILAGRHNKKGSMELMRKFSTKLVQKKMQIGFLGINGLFYKEFSEFSRKFWIWDMQGHILILVVG